MERGSVLEQNGNNVASESTERRRHTQLLARWHMRPLPHLHLKSATAVCRRSATTKEGRANG